MTRQGRIQGELLNDIAEAVCNFPAKDVAGIFNIKEGTIGNYTGYAKAIYRDNPKAEEIYCRLNKSLRAAIKSKITMAKNANEKIEFLEIIPYTKRKTGVTRKYAPRKSNGRVSLPIDSMPREKKAETKHTNKIEAKEVLSLLADTVKTIQMLVEKL